MGIECCTGPLHSSAPYDREKERKRTIPFSLFFHGNEPPSPRCCIDKADHPCALATAANETLFRDSIVLHVRPRARLSAFTLACSFYKPTRLMPGRAPNARDRMYGVTTVKEVEHVEYASANCIDNRRSIFNSFH